MNQENENTMPISERIEKSKLLRRGDVSLLSELSGITPQAIGQWLRGERKTSTVEQYFYTLVKKREKQYKENLAKIQ